VTAIGGNALYRTRNGESSLVLRKLDAALEVLKSSLSETSPIPAQLASLGERLTKERLQLAIVGQFKRGKSTFINALLGAPVLPTAVVPLTAIAAFIAWRAVPQVRIHFKDGSAPREFMGREPEKIRAYLFDFVSEEANPKNRLGVERVELFYPADILADGVVLIDTPGIGSTFRHNTDAAFRIIPECDVALFVVSADPPITEIELEYLHRLKATASRTFFILNKADYLNDDERTTMADFLRKALSDQSGPGPADRIFTVSARRGLLAEQNGDRAELEKSGIAEVEEHLVRYFATDKLRSLEQTVRKKAADLVAAALEEIRLHIQTLKTPLEDLATKAQLFETALKSIEEQRLHVRDLLTGERRRLFGSLEARTRELRREAASKLASAVDACVTGATGSDSQRAKEELAVSLAQIFEKARDRMVSEISIEVKDIITAHQRRIEAIIDRVRQAAADIFEISFQRHVAGERLELRHEPYWVTQNTSTTLIPDPSRLIDRFLPLGIRSARLRGRLVKETDVLVLRNAENLRWAIICGLEETFRSAAAQFEERLDESILATTNVIAGTLTRRRESGFSIEPEIERLHRAVDALSAIRDELLA
jgi:GTPase SAR1 family protein